MPCFASKPTPIPAVMAAPATAHPGRVTPITTAPVRADLAPTLAVKPASQPTNPFV